MVMEYFPKGGVTRPITPRITKAELEWTANKLLLGAGAGADPTEIDVPGGATIVRKTANQTVNNSIVLVNDTALLFAIAANEVWEFTLIPIHNSGTTPDIKFCIIGPAGASAYYIAVHENSLGAVALDRGILGDEITFGGTASNRITGTIKGIVINGATAGNLQLQWAQATANASNTIVLANSCLIANRLA